MAQINERKVLNQFLKETRLHLPMLCEEWVVYTAALASANAVTWRASEKLGLIQR